MMETYDGRSSPHLEGQLVRLPALNQIPASLQAQNATSIKWQHMCFRASLPHLWHRRAFWQILASLPILCICNSSRPTISSRCTPPRTPRWSQFPVEDGGTKLVGRNYVGVQGCTAGGVMYSPGCTRHSRSCSWTLWWWRTPTVWGRRRPTGSWKRGEECISGFRSKGCWLTLFKNEQEKIITNEFYLWHSNQWMLIAKIGFLGFTCLMVMLQFVKTSLGECFCWQHLLRGVGILH